MFSRSLIRWCPASVSGIGSSVLMQRVEQLEQELSSLKREKVIALAAESGPGKKSALVRGTGKRTVEKSTDDSQVTTLKSDKIQFDPRDGDPERISSKAAEELYRFYAQLNEQQFSMQTLTTILTMTDLLQCAQAMWREFQVRIAKRSASLANAPFGLSAMPSIRSLLRWYEISFEDMRKAFPNPPTTEADLLVFDDLMRRIFVRHGNTAYLFGGGLFEFGQREGWTKAKLDSQELYVEFREMEDFFHNFVKCRVQVRFLIQHYLECSSRILRLDSKGQPCDKLEDDPTFGHDAKKFVGAVCAESSIPQVVECAVNDALQEAKQDDYDDLPDISVKVAGDPTFVFPHIPAMSHNIISALVGDAIRQRTLAQARSVGLLTFADDGRKTDIQVMISQSKTNKDVVIQVHDACGGIPHKLLPYAGNYVYSVRTFFEDRDLSSPSSSVTKAQGWMKSAVRVPYARAAAQAFGGDVTINSMDGYSTDRQYYIPTTGLTKILV